MARPLIFITSSKWVKFKAILLNFLPRPVRGGTRAQKRQCYRKKHVCQEKSILVLRVFDLSGFVARKLSGRHITPKGEKDETNGAATGDTENEIRRSLRRMEQRSAYPGRSRADTLGM
jgi:hypothetical protein